MIVDVQFAQMLQSIMLYGNEIETRNSKTKRLINQAARFESTPLISVRRTAWKNALREFEWFMSGSNNINDLHEKVRHWWEPWADESGFIHNNYSKQFRKFEGSGFGPVKNHHSVDQIEYMIETLKNHPNSRRNVITTWHTHDMLNPITPITNCHGSMIQVFVEPDNSVHLTMYQRSSDMVLGLPHNFIQYWAFLMYLAHQSGKKVGTFTWIGGDCHIYENHYDMTNKIITQAHSIKDTPQLVYNPTSESFKADDFSLSSEYNPVIKENLKMTV